MDEFVKIYLEYSLAFILSVIKNIKSFTLIPNFSFLKRKAKIKDTGKIIPGDPIKDRLDKIVNFVSGGLSGMLAPLKQAIAEAIAKAVNLMVKVLSKFVPMAVLKLLMSYLNEILDIFCGIVIDEESNFLVPRT